MSTLEVSYHIKKCILFIFFVELSYRYSLIFNLLEFFLYFFSTLIWYNYFADVNNMGVLLRPQTWCTSAFLFSYIFLLHLYKFIDIIKVRTKAVIVIKDRIPKKVINSRKIIWVGMYTSYMHDNMHKNSLVINIFYIHFFKYI